MDSWDYRQTILRQDEVAGFIHDRKGDKYSALLPLFGLHDMEVAAENLRQLARAIESESGLKEMKFDLKQIEAKREAVFGSDSYEQILKTIKDLHTKYCAGEPDTIDVLFSCEELEIALATRIDQFGIDGRRHFFLQSVADLDLKGRVTAVRAASVKLASAVDPLINEKLEILRSSRSFVDKLEDDSDVNCPACGQLVPKNTFQEHVEAEHERLQEVITIHELRKDAIGTLCDDVKSLKSNMSRSDLKSWRDKLPKNALADKLKYLDGMNPEELRASCDEQGLREIEDKLLPVVAAAALDSRNAPPDVRALSSAKEKAGVGRVVIAAKDQATTTARVEALVAFVNSLERGVREQIRLRSQKVIDNISADIKAMWATLHPGEAIEDVRLYLPPATDKAIDIGLKFHGIEQDSPRLTLSEGYRNSLGLCIFLAIAKREADDDRPLFLDDVVVSLDRYHRGMIVELLEKEFSGRQVVILTHDRDWYTEMRHQLEGNGRWIFRTLLPYETPDVGIRWSHKTTTFDDARAQVKERPDSAGNDARKIMDVELAIIAEDLRIELPYLRSDKNDKRMAYDFLNRLVADGKKCFQKRTGNGYSIHVDAIEACDKANRLLVSWANRASHGFDLVRPEAIMLIDACEKALSFFKCLSCSPAKPIWFLEAKGPLSGYSVSAAKYAGDTERDNGNT